MIDDFEGTFEQDFKNIFKGGYITTTKESEMGADFSNIAKNFKPTEQTDDNSFKPLKGAYVCRIDRLEHKTGTAKASGNAYDFYSLKMQVTETVEGDKGDNRFLDKMYKNDDDGIQKIITDMFTSKIEGLDVSSVEAFDGSLGNVKDKSIKVRTWVWVPEKNQDGSVIPEDQRVGRQQLKVVNEFQLGKSGKKSEKKSNEVPF